MVRWARHAPSPAASASPSITQGAAWPGTSVASATVRATATAAYTASLFSTSVGRRLR